MNGHRGFSACVQVLFLAVVVASPLNSWAQTKATPSTTKTLRPASAKPLIQEAVNSTNRGSYLIDFTPLIALQDKLTFVDYSVGQYEPVSPEGQIQRLLRSRLAQLSKDVVSVPKLAGMFGHRDNPGLTVQLSMDPNDPRLISGTFEKPGLGARCAGRIRGSWIVAGFTHTHTGISLFFDTNPGSGCLRSEAPVEYAVTRTGELLVLVHQGSGTVYVQGRWNGEVALSRYAYGTTEAFDKFVQSLGKLQAGHIEVDSVEELFLSPLGETAAECRFKWHVQFNEAARALTEKSSENGLGRALFRKQPDGDWALTQHSLR